ncbi:MAG: hypothetical protein M0R33_11025 [Methylomonas sp.]|uniref:hypothetical protein n=1 Tax=Methylomonas sp. TaxID=418 RepID=UPI0025F23617|nr:hypothetical protein [Methylomonas sp.]MCK9606964.1 hypothetical protein [Methylomonas sp.]
MKPLEKLRIELRSRPTNDNVLAKSKNASIVAYYLADSHIPEHFARQMNASPCRCCRFPSEYQDNKAKIRNCYSYQDMTIRYEKFRSPGETEGQLKQSAALEKMDAFAAEYSDNDAGQSLNEAKAKHFQLIDKSQHRIAWSFLTNHLRSGLCLD